MKEDPKEADGETPVFEATVVVSEVFGGVPAPFTFQAFIAAVVGSTGTAGETPVVGATVLVSEALSGVPTPFTFQSFNLAAVISAGVAGVLGAFAATWPESASKSEPPGLGVVELATGGGAWNVEAAPFTYPGDDDAAVFAG